MKTYTKVIQGKSHFLLNSQQADLFKVMREHRKPLTVNQLRQLTGLALPTNRMSELIAKGVNISKNWKRVYNDKGELTRVKTYLLESKSA